MTRLILIVNAVPTPGETSLRVPLEAGQQVDLLICVPHLPRHASRWLTPRQRMLWRTDWAAAVQAGWRPLCSPARLARATLAQGPLHKALGALQAAAGEAPSCPVSAAAGLPARVLDRRCSRPGADLEPLSDGPLQPVRRWVTPLVASSSLSALLFLAD